MSNSQSGIITDPRFASLHHDPRFAKHKKHGSKDAVDARFAAVLDDPRFQDKKVNRNNKRPRTQDSTSTDANPLATLSSSSSSTSVPSASQKKKNNHEPQEEIFKKNKHATAADQTKANRIIPSTTLLSNNSKHIPPTDARFAMASHWQNEEEEEEDDDDMEDNDNDDEDELLADYERAIQEDAEEEDDGDKNDGNEDNDSDDDDDKKNRTNGAKNDHPTKRSDQSSSSSSSAIGSTKNKFAQETVQERLERLSRMARGEANDSGSEAASSSESEYEDDNEDNADYADKVIMDLEGPEVVQDPEAPNLQNIEYMEGETIDQSSRLALVNCDWDHLRATDIMATLQSFLPPGRSILRVDIYYSDYGMKRLQEESLRGPQNIFKQHTEIIDNPSSSLSSSTTDHSHGKKPSTTTKKSTGIDLRPSNPFHHKKTEEEAFDPERLRQYELNKMKYFFAIITFDSAAAADSVYTQCDGIEIESTSNVLDLRVVPSDQSFKDRKLFDSASHVPDNYQPPTFHTRALQSSRIELTWDGDDPQRNQALDWDRLAKTKQNKEKRKGHKNRRNDDDDDDDDDNLANLKSYLASSESEEEEDEIVMNEKDDDDVYDDEKANSEDQELGDSDDKDDESDQPSTTKLSKKEARLRARAKYRALLFGESTISSSSKKQKERRKDETNDDNRKLQKDAEHDDDDDDDDDDDELADKSMTFIPGAGEAVLKAKADREARAQESSFEAFQRKRKEKKKEKKAAWKASIEQRNTENGNTSSNNTTNEIQHVFRTKNADDNNLDEDTFFSSSVTTANKKEKNKTKGKGRNGDDEEEDIVYDADFDRKNSEAYKRAQLELLGIGDDRNNDDNDGSNDSDRDTKSSKNYNLSSLLKEQKLADKAAKKSKKFTKPNEPLLSSPTKASSSDFNVDIHDSRFAAVFNAPEYSIDPTAPQYKDTSGMRKILHSTLTDHYQTSTNRSSSGNKSTNPNKSTSSSSSSTDNNNTTSRPMVVVRGNPSSSGTVPTGTTNNALSDGSDVRKLAESVKHRFAQKK